MADNYNPFKAAGDLLGEKPENTVGEQASESSADIRKGQESVPYFSRGFGMANENRQAPPAGNAPPMPEREPQLMQRPAYTWNHMTANGANSGYTPPVQQNPRSQTPVYTPYTYPAQQPPVKQAVFRWKTWMTVVSACVAVVVLIVIVVIGAGVLGASGGTLSGQGGKEAQSGGQEYYPGDEEMLSESCDYVLCMGTDTDGNFYELVANQKESSLGYEITVGVIKNNKWIYPMSDDFPFLGEGGLFHVSVSMAGESGTSLTNPNSVIDSLYFIDSGGFLMESYTETDSWVDTYDHTLIIFSCETLKSYTVDCEESTLLYLSRDAKFHSGDVVDYGYIQTENGKLALYSEVSGTSSGWLEDQVFDWSLLDTNTLKVQTFGSGVEGIRPESVYSEGLIFASDQCFYNVSMQKVIDLSAYDIDMFYDSGIYFKNGTCTFVAENDLGTQFEITIDTKGNVISEVQK